VCENRVLRRIFGPKREEVAGGWRTLHNEELHSLYTSPNVITVIRSRRMRWVGDVTRIGDIRNAYKILVGKTEDKRPLGKPRRRWENNNGMDLSETGWEVMNWMHLAQDGDQWRSLLNTVMNIPVP
jgi:hypothetical protein